MLLCTMIIKITVSGELINADRFNAEKKADVSHNLFVFEDLLVVGVQVVNFF